MSTSLESIFDAIQGATLSAFFLLICDLLIDKDNQSVSIRIIQQSVSSLFVNPNYHD